MSITYKLLALPSTALVFIGKRLIGNPINWGLDVTPEEFYCMPVDRSAANPQLKTNAGQWGQMYRNNQIDYYRRKVYGRLCIYMFIFSAVTMMAGTATVEVINKTKSVFSELKVSISSKQQKEDRITELKKQADELSKQAKSGLITREEYEAQAQAIDDEYKQLSK